LIVDETAGDRITATGPETLLPPRLALNFALVIHELGTNARKHGALSTPTGRVTVTWSLRSAPPALELEWKESGSHKIYVPPNPNSGFGTILIDRVVRSEAGGEAHMQIESDGIRWKLLMPLPSEQPGFFRSASLQERSLRGALSQSRSPRILVIEDEPLLALDVSATLNEAGFEVVGPVHTLDEAMRFAAMADFNAVLLDANLAGRPVDQLAAALTRLNIPFAFVTGYGREGLPKAFASAPMLSKPFTSTALVNMLKGMLSANATVVPLRPHDRDS
jgi:CheY-like chemotaxis protein